MVGSKKTLDIGVNNSMIQQRHTSLGERLKRQRVTFSFLKTNSIRAYCSLIILYLLNCFEDILRSSKIIAFKNNKNLMS